MHRLRVVAFPVLLAVYMPSCAAAVRPTVRPSDVKLTELWQRPDDIARRDLFNGPWGTEHAPSPADTYTLIEHKHSGVNPGMTVRDSRDRKWSVKQADAETPSPEGPIEVVLSRVLSAAGYHQPPVYYLPAFTLRDDWGTHTETGGRFRLHTKRLKEIGTWSWQQNPFVETRPYRALLTTLMIFNASDLKNSNTTLYEHRDGDTRERWYVVRDLGTALGETGRLAPRRGDPRLFARSPFIVGLEDRFVRFGYHGWHQELVTGRIRPDDVDFAASLLGQLSHQQWLDAFRAGGFPAPIAEQYIRTLSARIALGKTLGDDDF